jgi:hypothetical protein
MANTETQTGTPYSSAFGAVIQPMSRTAAHAILAAITLPLDMNGVLTRDDFLRIVAEQKERHPE